VSIVFCVVMIHYLVSLVQTDIVELCPIRFRADCEPVGTFLQQLRALIGRLLPYRNRLDLREDLIALLQ